MTPIPYEDQPEQEFRYTPKGVGVRASAFQLYALNKVPGGLLQALHDTDASLQHIDADPAFARIWFYTQEGLYVPKSRRKVV